MKGASCTNPIGQMCLMCSTAITCVSLCWCTMTLNIKIVKGITFLKGGISALYLFSFTFTLLPPHLQIHPIKCLHLNWNQFQSPPPTRMRGHIPSAQGTTTPFSPDLIFPHHLVVGAGVTSRISSTASSFLVISLSSSPLHLIPFPPCPLSLSLPLTFFLTPSFSLSFSLASLPCDFFLFSIFFFFFFYYCSSLHTPSCCSKSLKGTEPLDGVAVVIEALTVLAVLWVGCTRIQRGCTKTLQADLIVEMLRYHQIK